MRNLRGALFALPVVAFGLLHGPTLSATDPVEESINITSRIKMGIDIARVGETVPSPTAMPKNLMAAIANVRLVGVGEGTHGTLEHRDFATNLILELSSKKKVVVFLEDSVGAGKIFNNYVQGRAEEAEVYAAIKSVAVVHQTEDYMDFLNKVKAKNAKLPANRKIEIYGVDTYISPGPNDFTAELRDFCNVNSLGIDGEMSLLQGVFNNPMVFTPPMFELRTKAMAAALRVNNALLALDPSTKGLAEAKVMATTMRSWVSMMVQGADSAFAFQYISESATPDFLHLFGIRDDGMAENIKQLMDAKIPTAGDGIGVYRAHNAHVGRLPYLNDFTGVAGAWTTTGSIVGAWLGNGYYAIGTTVGRGQFRAHWTDGAGGWEDMHLFNVPSLDPNTLGSIATRISPSKPIFFETKKVSFANQARVDFTVGSQYNDNFPQNLKIIPGMTFNGICNFPTSTGTTVLR